MSSHPSLISKGKSKRSRSVLKRFERLKELLEKEKWKLGNSVFGLPKIKAVQLKLKKAKKAVEEEAAAAEPATEAVPGETGATKEKEEKPSKKQS